jgi:hypothetical protein
MERLNRWEALAVIRLTAADDNIGPEDFISPDRRGHGRLHGGPALDLQVGSQ